MKNFRYSPLDFDQHMVGGDELPAKPARVAPGIGVTDGVVSVGDLVIDPAADPPAALLDSLCDIDPVFKTTWECKRDPKKFPSLSESDLALASFAAHAGWSDQQIADLLIAFRRRHKDRTNNPDKALRMDYLKSTLARAHVKCTEIKQNELKKYFGVEILSITKYLQDSPSWEIKTDRGVVNVPDLDVFTSPSKLAKRFANDIAHYFAINKKVWPQVMNSMLAMQKDVIVSSDSIAHTRIKERLVEFISKFNYGATQHELSRDNLDWESTRVVEGNCGCVFIYFQEFAKWNMENFVEDSTQRLRLELKKMGCTANIKMNIKRKTGMTSKRFWRVPKSVYNLKNNPKWSDKYKSTTDEIPQLRVVL